MKTKKKTLINIHHHDNHLLNPVSKRLITNISWILLAALFSFLSFRIFVAAIDIHFRLISHFITGIAMIFGILFGNENPNTESLIIFTIILCINIPFLIVFWFLKFDKRIILFTFLFLFAQWTFNIINTAINSFSLVENAFFPSGLALHGIDPRVRAIFNAFIGGIMIGITKILLYNGQATFGSLDLMTTYFSIRKRKDITNVTFNFNILTIIIGIVIIQCIKPYHNPIDGTIDYATTVVFGVLRLLSTGVYSYASSIISEYFTPKNKIICCNVVTEDIKWVKQFLNSINVQRTFTHWPITNKDSYETSSRYNCYLVLTDYEVKLLKQYNRKYNKHNQSVFIYCDVAISVIGHFENINFQIKEKK